MMMESRGRPWSKERCTPVVVPMEKAAVRPAKRGLPYRLRRGMVFGEGGRVLVLFQAATAILRGPHTRASDLQLPLTDVASPPPG
jgi:hypothetical protein